MGHGQPVADHCAMSTITRIVDFLLTIIKLLIYFLNKQAFCTLEFFISPGIYKYYLAHNN